MTQENPPVDHVHVEEEGDSQLEDNLKSKSTWMRLLFMVVFAILANIAGFVTSVVVVLGFLWVLFTGETNEQLKQAGRGLATYIQEILRYLTYNSEDKPFPFGNDWPSPDA